MTQVIHIRNAPAGWKRDPRYLYIGRPSYLGNPFVIGRDGNREEVIEKYRGHLKRLREEDPEMFDTYLEDCVRGSILVCYCKPPEGFKGRLLCHGQIVAGYVDGVPPESIE